MVGICCLKTTIILIDLKWSCWQDRVEMCVGFEAIIGQDNSEQKIEQFHNKI